MQKGIVDSEAGGEQTAASLKAHSRQRLVIFLSGVDLGYQGKTAAAPDCTHGRPSSTMTR